MPANVSQLNVVSELVHLVTLIQRAGGLLTNAVFTNVSYQWKLLFYVMHKCFEVMYKQLNINTILQNTIEPR